VRWDELKPELTADHFNVANMLQRLARLRRDPWADFTRLKQTLPRQAARAV
jgi:DNA primase